MKCQTEKHVKKVIYVNDKSYITFLNEYTCTLVYDKISYNNVYDAYHTLEKTTADFDKKSYHILLDLMVTKFKLNKILRQRLLNTEDAEIKYKDSYGDIGKMLMRVRERV